MPVQILGGKDRFINSYFDPAQWGAVVWQNPDELQRMLQALDIEGATLKGIRFLDGPDCMTYSKDERQYLFPAEEFYKLKVNDGNSLFYTPNGTRFSLEEGRDLVQRLRMPVRFRVHEPLLLITDRGTFEILYNESSSVRVSKNLLPANLRSSRSGSLAVFDSETLLAPLLGQPILSVDIQQEEEATARQHATGLCNYPLASQDTYIGTVRLVFANRLQLCFDDAGQGNGNVWLEDTDKQWIWRSGNEIVDACVPSQQLVRK